MILITLLKWMSKRRTFHWMSQNTMDDYILREREREELVYFTDCFWKLLGMQ